MYHIAYQKWQHTNATCQNICSEYYTIESDFTCTIKVMEVLIINKLESF